MSTGAVPPRPELRWARRHGDVVVAWEAVNPDLAGGVVTDTFSVRRGPKGTLVTHRLPLDAIDDDLGDRIAAELVRPGLVAAFEPVFAGVVGSTAATPQGAWANFYARTLMRLRKAARVAGLRAEAEVPGSGVAGGAIRDFAAIYDHAIGLLRGSTLLDVGSCFGFFCLLAAERDPELSILGTDIDAPTMILASRMASRLGVAARFEQADLLDLGAREAATVTALHVLEHLEPAQAGAALASLCAAAHERVVVAVPLEAAPDPTYGHRTAFGSLAALRELAGARPPGWSAEAHERHGGWLVLDRD